MSSTVLRCVVLQKTAGGKKAGGKKAGGKTGGKKGVTGDDYFGVPEGDDKLDNLVEQYCSCQEVCDVRICSTTELHLRKSGPACLTCCIFPIMLHRTTSSSHARKNRLVRGVWKGGGKGGKKGW